MVRGKEDYAAITDILNRSWKADKFVDMNTIEDTARDLSAPIDFDVKKDLCVVELRGEPVGFSRITRADRLKGVRSYIHTASLVPEARVRRIREAMLRANEARIHAMVSASGKKGERYYETEANSKRNNWNTMVLKNGYAPYRHVFEMVRQDLKRIPDIELPAGLEVRPVRPRDLKTIWRAAAEAFRDEPGFREQTWSDDGLKWFKGARWWTPELWCIAWDGDEVAGGVVNVIDEEENKVFGRNWGHTAIVFTLRPWRRKGLASALMARSLEQLKASGVEQAALAVDTENPSGALKLYKMMGFKVHNKYSYYRKPIR